MADRWRGRTFSTKSLLVDRFWRFSEIGESVPREILILFLRLVVIRSLFSSQGRDTVPDNRKRNATLVLGTDRPSFNAIVRRHRRPAASRAFFFLLLLFPPTLPLLPRRSLDAPSTLPLRWEPESSDDSFEQRKGVISLPLRLEA